MELPILLVFIIIGITVLLFITEFFPIDKIAFFIIVSLALLNLTTPEEAISGFANPATITILCLMIVAVGLEENGVIQWLTDIIKKLKILPLLLITPVFMLISASISAFISTTAVVIIFIKIVSQLAEKYNFSTSKLLMPISFAGILGGSCTLMGTSTNLLVNAISKDLGAEPFSFFEFTQYGLILLAIGVVFMTIASRFLPKDKKEKLEDVYGLNDYVFSLKIAPKSSMIEKRIEEVKVFAENTASILKLIRGNRIINAPGKYVRLRENDTLVLMCDIETIASLTENEDLIIHDQKKLTEDAAEKEKENSGKKKKSEKDKEREEKEVPSLSFVELLILPGSKYIGKTLRSLRLMTFEGAYPLAIKKRKNIRNSKERLIRKSVNKINLKPGDRLLLEMQENSISKLHNIENTAILNQHEFTSSKSTLQKSTALVILLLMVGLAASGVLTILTASLTGVAAMLLTKSISLEDIYHKINWQIIFLLAGMIPLGIAMTNTGTDMWISENLLKLLTGQEPIVVLGLLFGFTMLMSGTISNNATAIIMTPIAISVAAGLELPLKPFILAIMFAANYSFFTPVGYQTNALIYGTGVYKFKHFVIIGGILSLILWIVATLLLSTMLTQN